MSILRLSFLVSTEHQAAELLTARLVESGPMTVIKVVGDLDMSTTHLLTELADAVLQAHSPLVMTLDLAGLRFLCADGIRALLQVRDAAAARSTHLVLQDPSPITCRVLKVTDLLDAFEIKTSGAAALTAPPARL